MKTMKLAYYGSQYLFWKSVENILNDLFLTSMVVGIISFILYK